MNRTRTMKNFFHFLKTTFLVCLLCLFGISSQEAMAMPLSQLPTAQNIQPLAVNSNSADISLKEIQRSAEDAYQDFIYKMQKENKQAERDVEDFLAEASQSFDAFGKSLESDYKKTTNAVSTFFLKTKRDAEDASNDFDLQVQKEITDSQRALEDASKEFKNLSKKLERSAKRFPEDIQAFVRKQVRDTDDFLVDADKAIDQLITDIKRSDRDASKKFQAQIKADLQKVDRALEDASIAYKSLLQGA